ncbi:MAG: methyltransferase domain-containing protein [Pseudomonadota bacterium]
MEAAPLFNTDLIRRNRLRALGGAPDGSDFLLKTVCNEIADRLNAVERDFSTSISLHAGSSELASLLADSGKTRVVGCVEQDIAMLAGHATDHWRVVTDFELFPFAEASIGLVVSPFNLGLTNDLPGMLAQINRSLLPDGLLLAALPGAGTLSELRDALMTAEEELTGGASPRVVPFADIRDCGALLQRAGFALPVVDTQALTVRYDNIFALMHDLRNMGMANPLHARSRRPASRQCFLRAAEIYMQRYSDADGRIRATFKFIHMSGWKPHESQQKPLSPGSAKTRLADALSTREQKLRR